MARVHPFCGELLVVEQLVGVEPGHHLGDGVGVEPPACQTLCHLAAATSTDPEEPECNIPGGRTFPFRRGLTRFPGVVG